MVWVGVTTRLYYAIYILDLDCYAVIYLAPLNWTAAKNKHSIMSVLR